jgi:hypothetical protein
VPTLTARDRDDRRHIDAIHWKPDHTGAPDARDIVRTLEVPRRPWLFTGMIE